MNMKYFVMTLALTLGMVSHLQAASIQEGKALVEKNNCNSCHGPDLKSPIAPNYPKIAGQVRTTPTLTPTEVPTDLPTTASYLADR
jgi:cytochrome c553